MQFKKPNFWDLKKPNLLAQILFPLTLITRIINFIRKKKQKIKSKEIKTICVGNIYIGGTGKTPLTIKLNEIINDLNLSSVVAKKFYTNQLDEQKLLEKKSSLILDRNRHSIIKQAINRKIQVVIFDDGLQDYTLDYDLKCVCFKIDNWIGNGLLIPSGPLRENLNSLKNCDIVFLNGLEKIPIGIYERIFNINSNITIFKTDYLIKNLNSFDRKDKFLIFSGIGDPNSFKKILKNNKFQIIEEIVFPDHYKYKKNDLNKLISKAKDLNAKIITTEKDYMKLDKEFLNDISFIELDLVIENQLKLIEILKDRLDEKN